MMNKVDLCNRSRFGISFRNYDVDNLDDLKSKLRADNIEKVGVGYIDIFDDLYETKDLQPVKELLEGNFDWLVAEDKHCLRFLFKYDEPDA
jgi:hypothetical protein